MRAAGVAVLALLLWGCAQEKQMAAARDAPVDFPLAYYQQAAAQGRTVYKAVPGESLVTIVVRRSGALARLGHDHVVSGSDVQGYVDPQASRADLYLALDSLVVDDAALRAQAALDTQPSASDIAGTRSNMLASLEAQSHPYIGVRVNGAAGPELDVELTLHGVTRRFPRVPAVIESSGNELAAHGALTIAQSDFGITPFSILGGAIRVEDRLELRFRISARRQMP